MFQVHAVHKAMVTDGCIVDLGISSGWYLLEKNMCLRLQSRFREQAHV